MAKVIGSLDDAGFVSDIQAKADRAMAYFYLGLEKQSELYYGKIASLAGLIRRYEGDHLGLREATDELLNRYLGSIFEEVDLRVVTAIEGDSIKLSIDVIVRDGDKYYNIAQAALATGGTLRSLIDIQNGNLPILPKLY